MKLVRREGRIVFSEGGATRPATALQIFRVAIRGATDIDGVAVEAPLDESILGVRFRQETAAVALLLAESDGTTRPRPVVQLDGRLTDVALPEEDDHCLVDGWWVPLEPESLAALREWLSGAGSSQLTTSAYIDLLRADGPGFDVIDSLSDDQVLELPGGSRLAPDLTVPLYPYQASGLEWLSARAVARLGGILADEMGLGKTLQIIGLLAQTRRSAGHPNLIVVPLTLVENWSREIRKFAPTLTVYRHVGSRRTLRPSELSAQETVITTYETAVSDEAVLSMVEWNTVVLDEAQAIKNPDTLRSRAVKAIPRRAAFAVTGTPLENRIKDVWSISSFAVPGYLGPLAEFEATYEGRPEALQLALRPLLLRREVADVAHDLPPKIVIDTALEMFAPEMAGYESLIESIRGESRRTPILALITKLRLYTAHPDLTTSIQPAPDSRSAKLARLLEILEEVVASGAKTLIFVTFTKAADLIVGSVQGRFGVPTWTIDGRTAVAERQAIIDRFSSLSGPAVLVLNPSAGGVGLNIQAATHVVHYTLEWNPAREAQATARAWRRGQDRPVTVHRLYYAQSIDEFILSKLAAKQELFDDVITPMEESNLLRDLLSRALATKPA